MDFGYETSRFLEFSRRLGRAEAFCAESWNEPRFGRRIPALFGCRPIHIRRYAARLSARAPLRRASRGAPHTRGSFNLRRRRDSNSRDPFEPATFPRWWNKPLSDASCFGTLSRVRMRLVIAPDAFIFQAEPGFFLESADAWRTCARSIRNFRPTLPRRDRR